MPSGGTGVYAGYSVQVDPVAPSAQYPEDNTVVPEGKVVGAFS
jgi:hypothetical protein